MEKIQVSHLNMYKIVRDFFAQHPADFISVPEIAPIIAQLSVLIQQIEDQAIIQATDNKGLKLQRLELVEKLIPIALQLANALQALAVITANSQLEQEINYNESELRRATKQQLFDILTIIHQNAAQHQADIQTYGITQAIITNFQADIAQYQTILNLPEASKEEVRNATQHIKQYLKQANDLLILKLDKIMLVFKTNNEYLYNEYKNKRTINNPPSRQKSITGIAVEKTTNTPIAGVEITIPELNKTTKTSKLGKYTFYDIISGVYSLIAIHKGYKQLTITAVPVSHLKTKTLNLIMNLDNLLYQFNSYTNFNIAANATITPTIGILSPSTRLSLQNIGTTSIKASASAAHNIMSQLGSRIIAPGEQITMTLAEIGGDPDSRYLVCQNQSPTVAGIISISIGTLIPSGNLQH